MADFVTALTTGITPAALWGALTSLAPIVVVMVIFSFGYYVVRRIIKGAGKGKTRI